MQQAALSRDSIQNLQEEVNTLLRKIAANVHHLLTIMLQGIGHTTVGGHFDLVHLAEEVGILTGKRVHLVRLAPDAGTQGLGMQHLIDQAILLAHAHDIERDSRGHPHHKGLLRHRDFAAHILYVRSGTEDLNNGVFVEPIDRAYAADTDDFAALYTQPAQRTLDVHDLGKTGHLEHVIDGGLHIADTQVPIPLGQRQQHSKTGTGYIIQCLGVHRKAFGIADFADYFVHPGSHLLRRRCIQPAG